MKLRAWAGAAAVAAMAGTPSSVFGQDAPAAGSPGLASWTSDVVVLAPGTLVTILIDEYTVATADRDDAAVRERDRQVSLDTPGGGLSARTENNVSSRTRGGATRRERFSAEITARIVEMLPGGLARIEGTKIMQIDAHEQSVTIKGIIRPQDVSLDNTIESWRVADAEILYEANGSLAKAGGFWSKLLDLIVP
jgi:flagellar L-ring protein precursor FlgH